MFVYVDLFKYKCMKVNLFVLSWTKASLAGELLMSKTGMRSNVFVFSNLKSKVFVFEILFSNI